MNGVTTATSECPEVVILDLARPHLPDRPGREDSVTFVMLCSQSKSTYRNDTHIWDTVANGCLSSSFIPIQEIGVFLLSA
jgi:hypothetical protein